MAIRKKIKISSAKRGHHEKQKKNFTAAGKVTSREKQVNQNNTNIFGKKRNAKRSCNHMNDPPPKTSSSNNLELTNDDIVADLMDMMDSVSEHSGDCVSDDGLVASENRDDEMMTNFTEKLEDEYKKQANNRDDFFGETQHLLPIKTKKGFVSRSADIGKHKTVSVIDKLDHDASHNEGSEVSTPLTTESSAEVAKAEVRATDLILERDEEIERNKFIIGVTCASILENPEIKVKHLAMLLELTTETSTSGKVNMFVIRKLAMISLVEVFKDIVPEYRLGIINTDSQKLKKTTLARVSYENELLLQYKKFLVHCECFTKALQLKRGGNDVAAEEKYMIGEVAVQCLCDLLIAHPYFNFGANIGQTLVTHLNNDAENIRKRVHACFTTIFKTDSRYDISTHVVRHINQLVKKKEHNVYSEMVSCLKHLQINDVNINAEKAKELKLKKLEAHKSRVINMSRQERKRKKKLVELEKELFETKAEESKQIKQKKLTELTKLVFTIFFRILKTAPKSKLLSVTLEGLSKFAHTISIEFFSDLIEVLNNLLVHADLGYREQLHCIQTVFTVLRGQGEVLNIDPARFYTHLYKNLLNVHGGKNHEDLESILATLDSVLLKRRNNITYHRYLAFIKRISMMTLQLLHYGTLGCLGVIKTGMLLNSSLDILLDTDTIVGSGKYDPEVDEPEFSNANCTSLYELTALCRHYHPSVRRISSNISKGVPSSGPGMLPAELGKLTPHELYVQYDSSKMKFNPAIPVPKQKKTAVEGIKTYVFVDHELEMYCARAQSMQCSESLFNFL